MVKPDADDWRLAAETGTARRDEAEAGGAPKVPSWTPASAGIPAAVLQDLIDWAREGAPNEACGLLAATRTAEDGGVPSRFLPMKNEAASPYRYEIDPADLYRLTVATDDADEVFWGIVHSHTHTPAVPSPTDLALAFYPDALYVLVSLSEAEADQASGAPSLRAWRIVDGEAHEVAVT